MTPHLFYVTPAEFDATEPNVSVRGEDGRHAVTVKRIRVGEVVTVSDGAGRSMTGPVAATRGKDELDVVRSETVCTAPATPRISVVQAAIKSDRLEAAVEGLTEVGVDEIIIFGAERTTHPCQAQRARERVKRRVREAAKQSRRTWIPEVEFVDTLTAALASLGAAPVVLGLDEAAATRLTAVRVAEADIAIVVGPEGGLTDTERELIAANGGSLAQLGESVLRANTAGIAALGWLMGSTGRW